MPTNDPTAVLPAPVPASFAALEAVLYTELARHLAAAPPGGHLRGRYLGYIDGLAVAIHHITGEPVADITATARDEAQRAS